MEGKLPPGIYESPITAALEKSLAQEDQRAVRELLDPEESPRVIARYVSDLLARALRHAPGEDGVSGQVALANKLIGFLAQQAPDAVASNEDRLTTEVLLELTRRDPLARDDTRAVLLRPGIPLRDNALLVNARGEHRIGDEIRREIATADRIDLLCSFLLWSGYVTLREELAGFLRRNGPGSLRLITTVYCGVTERRVLDALAREGASVKVSFDQRRTRLHAKAWLFKRDTGFHTAYVGSSNLSAAALTDGLEWNVRVSHVDSPAVLGKFRAAFDGYWEDPEFEPYDPERDGPRFDAATGAISRDAPGVTLGRIHPLPFQQEMLERLDAERRVHGRWQNLVVAATGTGKTVVAALDFQREAALHAPPFRLLFVAHRREILERSRDTFRAVLGRRDFGGLLVDGERPRPGQDVFASVQSLFQVPLEELDPGAFHYVVMDEFHHAWAKTYRRLLDHLRPQVLLGLTATPERADGQDILDRFNGHTAVELRLWDAIERNLLVPFQYFGLDDPADIRGCWRRGRLDLEALDHVYSGHDERAKHVLKGVRDHVAHPGRMKALGFCAGVSHARFMARKFQEAGLHAVALTGETSAEDRAAAMAQLEAGTLQAVFTVDLFNEGIDIPTVDTVVFLRPTESATVFIQQLGRGLRLAPGKRCLTVLDFIGNADEQFRYDVRFRALLGGNRRTLAEQVEQGFPVLPAGCAMVLTERARKTVLDNIKRALNLRQDRLVQELRQAGEGTTLRDFLAHLGQDPEEFYRAERSFTALRRSAGFRVDPEQDGEETYRKALRRLLTLDDPDILDVLRQSLTLDQLPGGEQDRRRVQMVLHTLSGITTLTPVEHAWAAFRSHRALRAEVLEILELLRERIRHVPLHCPDIGEVPLQMHCSYRLEQILAAFSCRMLREQKGVIPDPTQRFDLLLTTTSKSEKEYSPTTMYKDYALSPLLFHWQSMARTRLDSEAGQRHVAHRERGVTPLLFLRRSKKSDAQGTTPYTFLGAVDCLSHEGERPLSIIWKLGTPMPAALFLDTRVAA